MITINTTILLINHLLYLRLFGYILYYSNMLAFSVKCFGFEHDFTVLLHWSL